MYINLYKDELYVTNGGISFIFKSLHNFTYTVNEQGKARILENIDYLKRVYAKANRLENPNELTIDQYVNEIILERCGRGLKIRCLYASGDYMLYFNEKEYKEYEVVKNKWNAHIPLPY